MSRFKDESEVPPMTQKAFSKAAEKHLATLETYVPVVARVHGGNHPEFHKVRKLYDAIAAKVKEADPHTPDLSDEFEQLRKVTNDYALPEGVCESYEAVYEMLSEIDREYHA